MSQKTAFFHLGEIMLEYDDTGKIFTNPRVTKKTQDYITGRFG